MPINSLEEEEVFENHRTLVMVAVGRGGGDRLSSGGAALAPLGSTEKPVL